MGALVGLPVLETAVEDATEDGVLIIASTGNEDADSVRFPARYSEVIGVGATYGFLRRTRRNVSRRLSQRGEVTTELDWTLSHPAFG
jgi:subtilisin family serine protease